MRKLIKQNEDLSDEDLMEARGVIYGLAEIAFDMYIEKERN